MPLCLQINKNRLSFKDSLFFGFADCNDPMAAEQILVKFKNDTITPKCCSQHLRESLHR